MKTKYGTLGTRKFRGKCEYCGKILKLEEAYQYFDSSNHAITKNSPYLCKECYNKQYWNDQIKDEK